MNHITFAPDGWLATFGDRIDLLGLVGEHGWAGLLLADWPISVVLLEHYRKALIDNGLDLGPRVPVDRFIFAKGEPALRHLTKISGLPYRPKGLPWPRDANGAVMAFFMQFCFADSHDIVEGLPGDVLLVFGRTKGDPMSAPTLAEILESPPGLIVSNEYADSLAFEWYHLGLSDTIERDEIPDSSLVRLPTCYGIRHRSWDYVDHSRVAAAITQHFREELGIKDEIDELKLRVFAHQSGMKIGGIPLWPERSTDVRRGRFIGSFSGVSSPIGFPYPPFEDARSAPRGENETGDDWFALYEDAWLNFSIGRDKTVEWELTSWYNMFQKEGNSGEGN